MRETLRSTSIILIHYSLKNICKNPYFFRHSRIRSALTVHLSIYSWQSRTKIRHEVDPECPSDTVTMLWCTWGCGRCKWRTHSTRRNNGLRIAKSAATRGKCGLCSQKSSGNLYTWERGGGISVNRALFYEWQDAFKRTPGRDD